MCFCPEQFKEKFYYQHALQNQYNFLQQNTQSETI